MNRLLSAAAALLLAATGLLATWPLGAAAAPTVTVSIDTRNIQATGDTITDVCYVIVKWSNVGCDENADGSVTFQGVAPGTYSIHQTKRAAGFLPVGDFEMTITSAPAVQHIPIYLMSARTVQRTTANIALQTFDASSMNLIPGACYLIEGGSINGCDENADGQVAYKDVRVGTYVVRPTKTLDGYQPVQRQWIAVTHDGPIPIYAYPVETTSPASRGKVNVSLVSLDPSTGNALAGACYVIVNASIEGCDENGDGKVDYRDVTPGTYTVHQMKAPDDLPAMPDQVVTITNAPNQLIDLYQMPPASQTGTRVAIVSVDRDTGEPILGGACYIIVNASNEGCDENGDGQVDFQSVTPGTYTIQITRQPDGYTVIGSVHTITVYAAGDIEYYVIYYQRS
jgi:uncharacterized surface anchored protein